MSNQETKNLVFFIFFLRFLASCLITNAHYTGIYPTDIIANGGLLGDVLFFAVSGYCLVNVGDNFPKWYLKRIVRCFLPVWIITAVYMIFGFYTIQNENFFWWFIYPTNYHFVSSIAVLYIPYYFLLKTKWTSEKIPLMMGSAAVIYLFIYLFFYDKSYYHIDTVREPFILFIFGESMLLGAWFKINDKKMRNNFSWYYPVVACVLFVIYFFVKLAFAKYESISSFQIINQIVLFGLLFFIFATFDSLDYKMEQLPKFLKKIIEFIASMTLEIYVVQYVLIDLGRPVGRFPVNWLLITSLIILVAFILHLTCKLLLYAVHKLKTVILKGE